jgi:hypothetical protein
MTSLNFFVKLILEVIKMKNLLIVLFCIFLLNACSSDDNNSVNNNGTTPEVLKDVQSAIEQVFNQMRDSLTSGAAELAVTGIKEENVRAVLMNFVDSFPYVVDCCYVDTNGIMKYVEPEKYREYEGSDISDQEHIVELLVEHEPIGSNLFYAVEGFWAIDLEYPIFIDQKYSGSLSMLIEPKEFLDKIILPLVSGVPVEFWIMEESGRIVYDPDEEEIGRDIFTDDLYKQYPDLIELARTSLKKDSGEMSYEFYDTGMSRIIKKNAYWVSIKTEMISWKIFMTHPDNYIFDELSEKDIQNMQDDLQHIAENDDFLKDVIEEDRESLLTYMADFYIKYPNVYSVSWVDEEVIVRFGLPKENSLENFQFTREEYPEYTKFIESVEKGKETTFELELIEGKSGSFYMYPIKDGSEYYGMLYFIYLVES